MKRGWFRRTFTTKAVLTIFVVKVRGYFFDFNFCRRLLKACWEIPKIFAAAD